MPGVEVGGVGRAERERGIHRVHLLSRGTGTGVFGPDTRSGR